MENTNKLTNLVQDAQIILAKHLEPLGPTEKQTLQDLLQLLDGPRGREAIAAAPVQAQEPVSDTEQSREYLVQFMEQHFTDKTYHRYIRGQRGGVNLAGDFAWQMARALRIISAPVQPVAVPDGKPFAHFVQPSGFGPFIECHPSQVGSFPAYRAVPAAQGDAVEPHPFYTMDGQPCPPDIEDELGQLLLACDKAIEFLTVGPAIEVTEDVIKAMYNSNVVKLIPKLKAVLESRVSVKYPFAMLASIHGSRITEAGSAPIDHLIAITGAINISNYRMMQNFENYTANIDTLNIGQNTMPYLADMVIHMQRIMTTFGWTWDDVKLKARQQMAEHE